MLFYITAQGGYDIRTQRVLPAAQKHDPFIFPPFSVGIAGLPRCCDLAVLLGVSISVVHAVTVAVVLLCGTLLFRHIAPFHWRKDDSLEMLRCASMELQGSIKVDTRVWQWRRKCGSPSCSSTGGGGRLCQAY